jgi:hypothetical protein
MENRATRSSSEEAATASTRVRGATLDLGDLAPSLALFALSHLHLPGPYHDEALDVAPAVRLLLRSDVWPHSLLPHTVAPSLMVCDHVGPTSTYVMLPSLWWFGVSVTAVRAYQCAVGLVSLVTVFLWARRVVPAGAAGVAALLVAPMPSLWLACFYDGPGRPVIYAYGPRQP